MALASSAYPQDYIDYNLEDNGENPPAPPGYLSGTGESPSDKEIAQQGFLDAIKSYLGFRTIDSLPKLWGTTSTEQQGAQGIYDTISGAYNGGAGLGQGTIPGQGLFGMNSAGGYFSGSIAPAIFAVAGTVAGNELADKYGGGRNGAGNVAYNALNALNPLNALYQVGEDSNNLMHGEPISLETQVATAIPTFGTSFLYNPVFARGGLFGSSKDKDQQRRDSLRGMVQGRGVSNESHRIPYASGREPFDLGSETLSNGSPAYNVDFSQPLAGDIVATVNPLAFILSGGDPKETSDLTGMLTNYAYGGGEITNKDEVRNNILNIYRRSGFTPDDVLSQLQTLYENGKINKSQYDVSVQKINSLKQGG